ncbi:hypothetical protein BC830DRAFT_1095816 [Chytriomyces sp. MP71]|nr:hypothetical protein BC830DRAFT_1095816 [Chytriomyces sp. MP71]
MTKKGGLYDLDDLAPPPPVGGSANANAAVTLDDAGSKGGGGKKGVVIPAGWTSGARLLAPVPVRRRPPSAAPSAAKRVAGTGTGVSKAPSSNQQQQQQPLQPPSQQQQQPIIVRRAAGLEAAASANSAPRSSLTLDEYDPANPNEFEAVKADAKRRRKERRAKPQDTLNNTNNHPASPPLPSHISISTHSALNAPQYAPRQMPLDLEALRMARLNAMNDGGIPADGDQSRVDEGSSGMGGATGGVDKNEEDDDDEDVDGVPMTLPLNSAFEQPIAPDTGDDAFKHRMALSAQAEKIMSEATGDEAYLRRMAMSRGVAPAAQVTDNTSASNIMDWTSTNVPTTTLEPRRKEVKPTQRQGPVPPPQQTPQAAPIRSATSTTISAPATMTRVVLLRNMVGPGEVDNELRDETATECSKFGPVERVQIYEARGSSVRADEAVSIFVKFRDAVAAVEAKSKMDGRFFGGRNVRAMFFPEARFDAGDLRI